MALSSEAYTIIGTLVGGAIGFAGTCFTQRTNERIEQEKIRAARFAQMVSDLAAIAHTTCWVTWSATHDYIDEKFLEDYNSEVHQILPRLIGSHIALAAVDPQVAPLTKKLVEDAHEVDEKIGIACVAYSKDVQKGVQMLAELNQAARQLDSDIFEKLAEAAIRPSTKGLLHRFAGWRSSVSSSSVSSAG